LTNYWTSPEIIELRKTHEATAYLVVIIGSRKILLWKLDVNGQLSEEPQLVDE